MHLTTILTALGLTWTAVAAGDPATPESRITILPEPIPQSATRHFPLAFRFTPPWPESGEWVYRMPETLGSNQGLIFIDHALDAPEWQPVTEPVRPVPWEQLEGGVWAYACLFDNGLTLSARVCPASDEIDIQLTLTNASDLPFDNLGTQLCLVQTAVPAFADRHALRTMIPFEGGWLALAATHPGSQEPDQPPGFIVTSPRGQQQHPTSQGTSWHCQEQADLPLIVTMSADGLHCIAVGSDNAYKVMTNAGIPCIHADPRFPDCAAGSTVSVRTKVYFGDNQPDRIKERFLRDFPQWRKWDQASEDKPQP